MTPDFMIKNYNQDGTANDRTADFKNRLLSMTINDYSGFESDSVTFVLDDSDGKMQAPSTKSSIRVWLGYKGQPLVSMGEFTVSQIEYAGWPKRLTVTATSMDVYAGLKCIASRSFSNMTIKEIIEKIAHDSKNSNDRIYEVTVGKDIADKVIKHEEQTNESSMNFLTRFARERDCIFKCTRNRIVFMKVGTGKTASGQQLPTINIDVTKQESNVLDYSVSYDRRQIYNTVMSLYHDYKTATTQKVAVGAGDPVYILPSYYSDGSRAEEAAEAQFNYFKRHHGQFSITLIGKPARLYRDSRVLSLIDQQPH